MCSSHRHYFFFFSFFFSYVIGLPYARSLRGWTQGPLSHPQLRGIYLVTRHNRITRALPQLSGGTKHGWKSRPHLDGQRMRKRLVAWGLVSHFHTTAPPKLWVLSSHSEGHFIHYPFSSPNPLWKETKNRKSTVDWGVTCNIPKRQKKPGTKQITYPYLLNLYGRIHTD